MTEMFGDDPRPSVVPTDDSLCSPDLGDQLVPVAFSFVHRRVRLLDLRGVDGREQSFRHTVSRWIAEHRHATPVEMAWAAFVSAARRAPTPSPAGFIFNVSRCGSTLLANILSASPGHLTVKESSTIGVLLRELLTATSESERLELENLLVATLPLFGRVGSLDGLPAQRLFVKLHSLSTVSAATLLRLFPRTPAVFLYRDPTAVVASMLAKAPYGDLRSRPREETLANFPGLYALSPDLPPATFYAHVWASPVESVLALPSGQCLLVDYDELVSNPRVVIRRLARHFGIDHTDDAVAKMCSVTGVYAKDASGTTPFDAAGVHRRPPPDWAERAEVAVVTEDLYARLKARRRAQM